MLLPFSEYSSRLLKRPADNDDDIAEAVNAIIDEVRTGGDDALRNLAERFDGWRPDGLFVTDEEIREASASVPSELKEAIAEAKKNILAFHEAQMPEEECVETAQGVVCSRKIVVDEDNMIDEETFEPLKHPRKCATERRLRMSASTPFFKTGQCAMSPGSMICRRPSMGKNQTNVIFG